MFEECLCWLSVHLLYAVVLNLALNSFPTTPKKTQVLALVAAHMSNIDLHSFQEACAVDLLNSDLDFLPIGLCGKVVKN